MDIAKVVPLIHVVRGQRIMLDEDLARLYGVPTRHLNQQVQRNLSSFPDDFMFRLTAVESSGLRSHFVISKIGRGGRRHWLKMSDVLMSGEGLAARIEKAEKALLGLEKEQGEHAAAIHELFAEFRRLADGKR